MLYDRSAGGKESHLGEILLQRDVAIVELQQTGQCGQICSRQELRNIEIGNWVECCREGTLSEGVFRDGLDGMSASHSVGQDND